MKKFRNKDFSVDERLDEEGELKVKMHNYCEYFTRAEMMALKNHLEALLEETFSVWEED